MIVLTRKTDYALVAMAELAVQVPRRISARKLAHLAHVPLPVLTNILNQLLHHGLLSSTRGAQGGYCLARTPEEITLAEIIEAVEGPVKLTRCCPGDPSLEDPPNKCDLESDCRIKDSVRHVHERLREFLTTIDLAHIARIPMPIPLTANIGAEYGDNESAPTPEASRMSPGRGW